MLLLIEPVHTAQVAGAKKQKTVVWNCCSMHLTHLCFHNFKSYMHGRHFRVTMKSSMLLSSGGSKRHLYPQRNSNPNVVFSMWLYQMFVEFGPVVFMLLVFVYGFFSTWYVYLFFHQIILQLQLTLTNTVTSTV